MYSAVSCWLFAAICAGQLLFTVPAPESELCSNSLIWPANWHFGAKDLHLCPINAIDTQVKARYLTTANRQLQLPKTVPDHSLNTESTPPSWTLPSHSAVFELDNGCVTGDFGMTFDTTTVVANGRWHRQRLPEQRPSLRRDFDTLVNLVIIWGEHYQHFMMETLPRLATLRKLHPGLMADESDKLKYLINRGPGLTIMTQLLGIPAHQIVLAQSDQLYCARKVLFPDLVDQKKIGLLPPGAYDAVLPLLRQPPTIPFDESAGERVTDSLARPAPAVQDARPLILYLRRNPTDDRGVMPELEAHVLRVLQRRVDMSKYRLHFWHPSMNHGWQQDRRLFHQAAIIVGPHGGAFSNLPFAPSNAIVIEIIPWRGIHPPLATDTVKRDVRPCYWSMATALGLTYYQFEPSSFGFSQPRLMFDGELLIALLDSLGALKPAAS
eukprot:TRINITY_DN8441_c0_g1_i2.p1 TRINITY_DN8441_c0_g1~~TRINITY_DN8441_c0_g1_i2.p1  ORF type:complete len:438 (+),score=73.34 TRINITY_DN8441_c0_g1_i2:302-1615(+)